MMEKPQRSLRITIDHQSHLVAPGTTVLDAARAAGITIPTLCHLADAKPPASCMVCLVKDVQTGANLPACATEVVDGMQLESETEAVHALRRRAIELLLSDHVGDCLAPCTLACPLHPDIPDAVRLIRAGKFDEAAEHLRQQLPLAPLLESLCTKPCEKACRRGRYDRAVAVSTIHQNVATRPGAPADRQPATPHETRSEAIAIVGGGMAGLAAAHFLNLQGYKVTVFEQDSQPGGRLREEIVVAGLADELLEEELKRLEDRGVVFECRSPIGPADFDAMPATFDAVLIACGPASRDLFGTKLDHAACFIAGDAIRSGMSTLHRAASGRDAAVAIDALVSGSVLAAGLLPSHAGGDETFSVRLGKLSEAELHLFAQDADQRDAGTVPEEFGEATRCFLCDCSDLAHCKLRQVAIRYGADPRRYHDPQTPRRELLRQHTPSGVTFEPGKCIRCGRCIEIVKRDPTAAGLTFIGRGFDAILSPPIGRTLDEALGAMAEACCEACPTGALMWDDEKE